MAYRSSRYQEPEEEEKRPRRRPQKAGPPIVPILALVVVIGGAVVVARMAAKQPKPDNTPKPEVQADEIFGGLAREEPPVPGQRGGGRATTNRAPSGIADNAVWIEALHKADQAAELMTIAKSAKAEGNHSGWNENANKAKALYNQALEDTALWEEELTEEFGDTDRQVRDIVRIRNKWFKMLDTLLKTTSR